MAYGNGGRNWTTLPSFAEPILQALHENLTDFPGIDGLRSNPVGLLEYPIGSLSAA